MVTAKGSVKNKYGIHCRPSGVISKAVRGYEGVIEIVNEEGKVGSPKSVLSMLGLCLAFGDSFTVNVTGPDEEAVCSKLVELLESEYEYSKE